LIYTSLFGLIVQVSMLYFLESVEAYFLSLMIAALFSAFLYYYIIGRKHPVIYEFKKTNFGDTKKLLNESFPIFAGSFFYILFFQIDTIMIDKILGKASAAEYSVGFEFARMFLEIFWVQFIIVYYPKMVTTYQNDKRRLLQQMITITGVVSFAFLLLFVISSFISPYLFIFFFGDQYIESAYVFNYSILSVLGVSIFSLYYRVLIIANKQGYYLKVMVVAAIGNFLINFILIDKFKIYGAIMSTMLIITFVSLFTFLKARALLRQSYAA